MYHRIGRSSAKTRPRRFLETAQGLVEYALILALVAVLAIGATAYLGGQVKGTLSTVGGEVLGANQTGPSPAPTPTSPVNPGSIHNDTDCWAADFFWYSGSCHGNRGDPGNYQNNADCVAAGYYWYQSSGNDCHTNAPNAGNINNAADCWANGFFWYQSSGNDCHTSPGNASNYNDSGGCQQAGFFWYGNDCHSGAQPTPPPPSNAHHGESCNPPGPDNSGHYYWDVVWNTSGGGHWDASWVCRNP